MIHRSLIQEKLTPQLLWDNLEPLITAHVDGYLIFNNTVLYKNYGKVFNLPHRQYSRHKHKVIRDIELVNCVYVNPNTHYFWVIDYRIYDRDGDGKNKRDHLL